MTAELVRVKLPGRGYDIHVGDRILANALKGLDPGKAFIIADSRLRSPCAGLKRELTRQGWKVFVHSVPVSERFKDFRGIYPLYGKLLSQGADRHSVVFALGGGVIGDAAGFLAGTFMRGIPWVGIPTTLLGQVDSAIGGKTAINHEAGKNLIGVFHQPARVVCDLSFLGTLSRRDRISGLGEMIKVGLIFDSALFRELLDVWPKVLELEAAPLRSAVMKCIQWKAKAVERDERDERGVREVLNFGHTLGHALEGITDFKRFRHGEAVLLGMRAACFISLWRGHLGQAEHSEIEGFLRAIPVPALPRALNPERFLEYLKRDKKAQAGRVRFVLLKGIGKTVSDANVTDREVLRALGELR